MKNFLCREQCGACCIAPSISSAMPLLPNGKAANMACPHLDDAFRCLLFNDPLRPNVCSQLQPSEEMCCNNRLEAILYLRKLEDDTAP